MKKAIALALSLALSLTMLAGCGGGSKGSADKGELDSNLPTYDSLTVGTDYTDLKADLRFITHRTDIMDTTFKDYVAQFNKLYPNITITYEGITDYANDMSTRISSKSWGDICMVPTSIVLPDLYLYFQPLCELSKIENDYHHLYLPAIL